MSKQTKKLLKESTIELLAIIDQFWERNRLLQGERDDNPLTRDDHRKLQEEAHDIGLKLVAMLPRLERLKERM